MRTSSVILDKTSETGTVMQTAIGQATTEVTPMHMAMLTAAIANGGNLMKPYFIESVENYSGEPVKKYMPSSCGKLMTAEEAALLTEYMTETVLSGTASKLQNEVYTAAGKTGSAEYSNDKSKSHAWYVGFSNVASPDLVVCVIVEGAGAGSEYAVPIAKKMFDEFYVNN
jgi:peptidoglycan glycosyltransferase